MTDFDEEDGVFAIRRSTQDKLTYKNIIAQAISQCNRSKGTIHFRNDVEALASTISFDVSGYKLNSKLIALRERLEKEKQKLIKEYKHQMKQEFQKHATKAKFKIYIQKWYWNRYYECILQLLAEHNLLFDTEKRIPVIQDKT